MNCAIKLEVMKFVRQAYFLDNKDAEFIAKQLQLPVEKIEEIIIEIREQDEENSADK